MKSAKPVARNILVNQLRHVACELYTLSGEIEQFGTMDKAEARLKDLPGMIETMRKAAWEVQQGRFDKASEIIDGINIEVGQEKLSELQAS